MKAHERLPTTRFPSAPSGELVDLCVGRGPLVLALVHSSPCVECNDFIQSLVHAAGSITEWDGRVTLVCESLEHSRQLYNSIPTTFRVLTDAHGELHMPAPGVIVADEWGEIYFAETTPHHAFPTVDAIVEWVRFIAVQCPECEQPEGEWRSIS